MNGKGNTNWTETQAHHVMNVFLIVEGEGEMETSTVAADSDSIDQVRSL